MYQLKRFIHYWFHALGPHSLQAPFVYNLYNAVIKQKPEPIQKIESLRQTLKDSEKSIQFESLGATSKLGSQTQSLKQIITKGNSSVRVSSFLNRLGAYLGSKIIIDLGTSTGLNTSYLAMIPESQVYTFEGNRELCNLAESNFTKLGLSNIKLYLGDITRTLPECLVTLSGVDMAFIDANHQYAPTMAYFEWLKAKSHNDTVIVFDDIHWSPEMDKAWKNIKADPDVTLTIDLFKVGLVFFRKELDKENLIVQV